MVLKITTGLMTHLTTHGLKSCKTFPLLDQLSLKALPARRCGPCDLVGYFSLSAFVNIHANKSSCLDMDRKWTHKNENLGNVNSIQKSRKY